MRGEEGQRRGGSEDKKRGLTRLDADAGAGADARARAEGEGARGERAREG